MKIVAITQVRYGSSRLPGKVLLEINGVSLLQMHLERIKKSQRIDKIIVATTLEPEADRIVQIAELNKIGTFRGSTHNVLDRFYNAAISEKPDLVVRITSDCPLIDHEVVDKVIDKCTSENLDYCSNTLDPSFPDGCDVEVFKFSALEQAYTKANLLSEKEHVTPYIWKNSSFMGGTFFKSANYSNDKDYSRFRLTVDEEKDYILIATLVKKLGYKRNWIDYVNLLEESNELFNINSSLKRNEGFEKSIKNDKMQLRKILDFTESDKYRSEIHGLIPGGAHTYSKGDDQFPERAPAAIKYGKDAYIWDLDGNKYLDCSMGLTAISLGHAYKPVVERVQKEIENGVNFQRPSYLEKEMAEKFLSLVPQHDMIKFAKNGSIVTTAAVKLARAFTNRKLVAFPTDHPFYSYDDWFIGTTDCRRGVPEEFSSLSVRFKSCDINSLKELFEKYPGQIACVITEPEKNTCVTGDCKQSPEEFLKEAIDLAHKDGALFIIDEMVTGFKTAFPGSMTKFGLKPDMATWGKGIANGFSFCALTGTKEVMELGGITREGEEKVFLISTTHGGETHALTAAIATIDVFKENDVIKHNQEISQLLIDKSKAIIHKSNLSEYISVVESNWLPAFAFYDKERNSSAGLRTLMMQEMISRGVLFQGYFCPCFTHTAEDIEYFAAAFEDSLIMYAKALETSYENYLIGAPAKPVFRKYL